MRTTKTATATRFDPYAAITDQIIELIEAGTAPWRKPWDPELGMPRSLTTGKVYRGINPFLLHMSAMAHGYAAPFWGTYKAIAGLGGQVRKGEKSTLIVFWKQYDDKTEVTAKGEPKSRFVLRTYRVFNAEQADNLVVPVLAETGADHDPIAECEAVIDRYITNGGPTISTGASLAAYSPGADSLVMPALAAFETPEEYYSTFFHELTHSTGHKDRLGREDLAAFSHFGDKNYSKEELVAEMGAAFLAGHTGIAPVTIEASASYLASWLKVLKADNKLVVQAAAQAQRAADLVLGVTFEKVAAEPVQELVAV